MTIGEICSREVIVVYQEESLSDAIRLMRKHHVGDVVVVADKGGGRSPIGIVTDRDILISAVGEGLDPDDITIGDVMSFQLLTASTGDSVIDALRSMREKGVRRLPVIDSSHNLVGLLTMDDVIILLAEVIGDLASLVCNEREKEIARIVNTGDPTD